MDSIYVLETNSEYVSRKTGKRYPISEYTIFDDLHSAKFTIDLDTKIAEEQAQMNYEPERETKNSLIPSVGNFKITRYDEVDVGKLKKLYGHHDFLMDYPKFDKKYRNEVVYQIIVDFTK